MQARGLSGTSLCTSTRSLTAQSYSAFWPHGARDGLGNKWQPRNTLSVCAAAPFSSTPQDSVTDLTFGGVYPTHSAPTLNTSGSLRGRVYALWDVDNKGSDIVPWDQLADKVLGILRRLGDVQEVYACGNWHTFNYVSAAAKTAQRIKREWVREESALIGAKVLRQGDLHRCTVCGGRFRSLQKLEQHVRELHVREAKKRLNANAPRKARQAYLRDSKNEDKLHKIHDLQVDLGLKPEGGAVLKRVLRKKGFIVEEVGKQDQAADTKIAQHARQMLKSVRPVPDGCPLYLCLVSDDRGFAPLLQECNQAGWVTVALCLRETYPSALMTLDWEACIGDPTSV